MEKTSPTVTAPASARARAPSSASIPVPAPAPASTLTGALNPREAWLPLPASRWNAANARHLLRRAAWSAQPDDIDRAVADGLDATLDRLFPARPVPFPRPELITRSTQDAKDFQQKTRAATTADQKRAISREQRNRQRQAIQDMTVKWLQFAATPANSAQEKWTLFLSDIYVIATDKVRLPEHVYLHHTILRQFGLGSAPALAKAVSRSPAMIRYLDLQDSKKNAPNENFARELFELFTLGEGNYTEQDIKQSARAFTGYGLRDGRFYFDARQHDTASKTIFGRTGAYSGDDVIDLAFQQPAAAAFVPREMARFYLTDEPLPKEHLDALGAWWRGSGEGIARLNLRALARRFFSSRLFYDPRHAGNYIKSPVQLYLGALQDLRLDVAPEPRAVIAPLRSMGQTPFAPPNVRGWVGGRNWINSATLAARRQLVQNLFNPLAEAALKSAKKTAPADASAAQRAHYAVDAARLLHFGRMPAETATDTFLKTFLAGARTNAYRDEILAYLKPAGQPAQRLLRVRNAAITLMQTPEYQLC